MNVTVEPAAESHLLSFHQALDAVAQEKIFLERIEAPPMTELKAFFIQLREKNWPQYFALDQDQVVGWADITPLASPRLSHRGILGMGVMRSYRGQGLGEQLLSRCLEQALRVGLEKVELVVNAENLAAIGLYKKMGFSQMGFVRHFRKLGDQYFDAIEMEKFLVP